MRHKTKVDPTWHDQVVALAGESGIIDGTGTLYTICEIAMREGEGTPERVREIWADAAADADATIREVCDMKTYKTKFATTRKILQSWKDEGGWLISYTGDRWELIYNLYDIEGAPDKVFIALDDDTSIDDVPEDLRSMVDGVTVRSITPSDLSWIETEGSRDSLYLDLFGYRFRASDHDPMTARSSAGVVVDLLVDADMSMSERDALLRSAARKWLRKQR